MTHKFTDYAKSGDILSLTDGALVFAPGDESRAFLIVLQGAVRVEQTNRAGRTVVLYRVAAGDSCVLTTACLLSGRAYSGYGYAEGDVTAVAISPDQFRRILRADPDFQQLVMENFATRVSELTGVIDDLLEYRTDLRLATWLSARQDAEIRMTQSDIAQELGTAREVVSRALKVFEARGWIGIERGKVLIFDRGALAIYGKSEGL